MNLFKKITCSFQLSYSVGLPGMSVSRYLISPSTNDSSNHFMADVKIVIDKNKNLRYLLMCLGGFKKKKKKWCFFYSPDQYPCEILPLFCICYEEYLFLLKWKNLWIPICIVFIGTIKTWKAYITRKCISKYQNH